MIKITDQLYYQPSEQTKQITQLLQYMLNNTYTQTELENDQKNNTVNLQQLQQNQHNIQKTAQALLDAIKLDLGPAAQLATQNKNQHTTPPAETPTDQAQNRLNLHHTIQTLTQPEKTTQTLTTIIEQLTNTTQQTNQNITIEEGLATIKQYEKNQNPQKPYTEYIQHPKTHLNKTTKPYTEYDK